MVQGQMKKASAPGGKPTARTTHGGITKKGLGQKNPKKVKLIKAAKINKKFTGGLTAQTERMLGEKAGHLEMIGKGRTKSGPKDVAHGKKNNAKHSSTKS